MNKTAKITVYKISECGYYSRASAHGRLQREFGDIHSVLTQLQHWSKGLQLAQTQTFISPNPAIWPLEGAIFFGIRHVLNGFIGPPLPGRAIMQGHAPVRCERAALRVLPALCQRRLRAGAFGLWPL